MIKVKQHFPAFVFMLLAGALCALLVYGLYSNRPAARLARQQASGITLTDVHAVDELRERFNLAAGAPRLILLLSPT